MGYLELKQPFAPKNMGIGASGPLQIELNVGRVASASQHLSSANRDPSSRKAADGRSEHLSGNVKVKGITDIICLDSHPEAADETTSRTTEENMSKAEAQLHTSYSKYIPEEQGSKGCSRKASPCGSLSSESIRSSA